MKPQRRPTPHGRLVTLGLIGLIIFSCSGWTGLSASFTIASRGRPQTEIVVPTDPEAPLAFAAEELQRYVREMSGAQLPIVHASSRKNSIVLTDGLQAGPTGPQADARDEDRYRISIAAGN